MYEIGEKIYYIDFEGKINQGLIKSFECDKKYTWVKINENLSIRLETNLISSAESEAYEKFKEWKIRYKNKLMQNNNWIKDLFNYWRADEDEYTVPKEKSNIMKNVIEEKTGIKLDDLL